MDPTARMQAALAQLRLRFAATAPATVERFRALAAALDVDPVSADVLTDLAKELHRFRGTAGSYGFGAASSLAGEFEARVHRWSAEPDLERTTRAADARRFVEALAPLLQLEADAVE